MTPSEQWNRDNLTGRAVLVRRDNGDDLKTVTRSSAFENPAGKSVIFVRGISGYYLLDRVTPYDGTEEFIDANHADGRVQCDICGKLYYDHPPDLDHLGMNGVPFLVKLCDGRSVKL